MWKIFFLLSALSSVSASTPPLWLTSKTVRSGKKPFDDQYCDITNCYVGSGDCDAGSQCGFGGLFGTCKNDPSIICQQNSDCTGNGNDCITHVKCIGNIGMDFLNKISGNIPGDPDSWKITLSDEADLKTDVCMIIDCWKCRGHCMDDNFNCVLCTAPTARFLCPGKLVNDQWVAAPMRHYCISDKSDDEEQKCRWDGSSGCKCFVGSGYECTMDDQCYGGENTRCQQPSDSRDPCEVTFAPDTAASGTHNNKCCKAKKYAHCSVDTDCENAAPNCCKPEGVLPSDWPSNLNVQAPNKYCMPSCPTPPPTPPPTDPPSETVPPSPKSPTPAPPTPVPTYPGNAKPSVDCPLTATNEDISSCDNNKDYSCVNGKCPIYQFTGTRKVPTQWFLLTEVEGDIEYYYKLLGNKKPSTTLSVSSDGSYSLDLCSENEHCSTTPVGLIVGLVVLVLVIGGVLLYYFLVYKKKNTKQQKTKYGRGIFRGVLTNERKDNSANI